MPGRSSNGWLLTLVDGLCSEYGWPLDYVLEELPLAQAFALFTAIRARNATADEAKFTYEDEEMIEELDSELRDADPDAEGGQGPEGAGGAVEASQRAGQGKRRQGGLARHPQHCAQHKRHTSSVARDGRAGK